MELVLPNILVEESRQHNGNILYKGKITSDSLLDKKYKNGTISLQVRQYGRRKWVGLRIHLDSHLSILDRIIYF